MRSLARSWFAAILLAGLCLPQADAQTNLYFRHDGGLAAKDEQPLPERLDAEHQLWKEPLPTGHSTPTILGDRIFVTGHDGPELLTMCLDRASGKLLWRHGVRVEQLEKFHNEGSPAAASVATDGERVYAFFGSFGLLCYNLDGKPLWSKKMGPFRDEFGSASSPILAGGNVLLNEDHDLDSFLISISPQDGQTVWQTPREGFTRSYATPVLWKTGGKTHAVISGALQLVAYDIQSGTPAWTLDGFARIVNTTPVVAGDMLYVCTWSPGGDSEARIAMEPWDAATATWDKDKDGKLQSEELPAGEVRSRFFRIDLDGDKALSEPEWTKYAKLFELAQNTMMALRADGAGPPKVVWEYKRGLPYVASPLVYRGQVTLVKDGGVITTLDAETGKLLKQARAHGEGSYYSSPVAGDGKIYIASLGGVMNVFRAGSKPEFVSDHEFGEKIAATPVIADRKIYVRTDKALYCFARP